MATKPFVVFIVGLLTPINVIIAVSIVITGVAMKTAGINVAALHSTKLRTHLND